MLNRLLINLETAAQLVREVQPPRPRSMLNHTPAPFVASATYPGFSLEEELLADTFIELLDLASDDNRAVASLVIRKIRDARAALAQKGNENDTGK